jgi:hypothetical protein
MTHDDSLDDVKSMAASIKVRCPSIEPGHAEALAFAWSRELDEIIKRTMKYANEMEGFRVEYAFRDDMIIRLADFSLWMTERILDAKATNGDL